MSRPSFVVLKPPCIWQAEVRVGSLVRPLINGIVYSTAAIFGRLAGLHDWMCLEVTGTGSDPIYSQRHLRMIGWTPQETNSVWR